jgi:hypothetical protein
LHWSAPSDGSFKCALVLGPTLRSRLLGRIIGGQMRITIVLLITNQLRESVPV